jgi:hypothetical protein
MPSKPSQQIKNMNKVKIEILKNVSRSKGWGRYSVTEPNTMAPLILSRTGNEWQSGAAGAGTKEAELAGPLLLTMQVMLKVGSGFRARQEITTVTHPLIAKEGEVVEITHRPGSQGLTLRITGAGHAITSDWSDWLRSIL